MSDEFVRSSELIIFRVVCSIGQIKIDVLLITPLEGIEQKFFVSPSKYWRQGRRPVNVGHRGLGKCRRGRFLSAQNNNEFLSRKDEY